MRSARKWQSFSRFVRENGSLLFMVLLVFIGVFGGLTTGSGGTADLSAAAVPHTVSGVLTAFARSGLLAGELLAVLFLAGMTAFGAPIALATPAFFGLGLGATAGSYYAAGWQGVSAVAVLVLPRALCFAGCLSVAAAESLKMSARLCRQLTAGGGMGGLATAFRRYLGRFLILLGVTAAGAAVDTALHILAGKWF